MRGFERITTVALAAAVTTAMLPAATAGAASSAARGKLVVCNHTGYLFDLYAEGPSSRTDDLSGSLDECTHWSPVRVGKYEIGYNARRSVGFDKQTVRIRRAGHVYYRSIGTDAAFHTYVAKNRTTRVDLGIPELP